MYSIGEIYEFVISSKVGDKKREMIVKKADEMKIRVLNRRDL